MRGPGLATASAGRAPQPSGLQRLPGRAARCRRHGTLPGASPGWRACAQRRPSLRPSPPQPGHRGGCRGAGAVAASAARRKEPSPLKWRREAPRGGRWERRGRFAGGTRSPWRPQRPPRSYPSPAEPLLPPCGSALPAWGG